MEYVFLGDDITDGIMAWISIGIDPTTDKDVIAAAARYSDSGEMNLNPPDRLGLSSLAERALQSSLKSEAAKATASPKP
jgi:hypothetical protein